MRTRSRDRRNPPQQLRLFGGAAKRTASHLQKHECYCVECSLVLTKADRKGMESAFTEARVTLDGAKRTIYWCRPCAERPNADIPDDETRMVTNIQGRVVRAANATRASRTSIRNRRVTANTARRAAAEQALLTFPDRSMLQSAA